MISAGTVMVAVGSAGAATSSVLGLRGARGFLGLGVETSAGMASTAGTVAAVVSTAAASMIGSGLGSSFTTVAGAGAGVGIPSLTIR